jgi:hypothetical protein
MPTWREPYWMMRALFIALAQEPGQFPGDEEGITDPTLIRHAVPTCQEPICQRSRFAENCATMALEAYSRLPFGMLN